MIIDLKKNSVQVLAVILIFALGFMALTLAQKKPKIILDSYENEIQKIEYQSTSDVVESIEADLNSTEFENIDIELQDIEKELQTTL